MSFIFNNSYFAKYISNFTKFQITNYLSVTLIIANYYVYKVFKANMKINREITLMHH